MAHLDKLFNIINADNPEFLTQRVECLVRAGETAGMGRGNTAARGASADLEYDYRLTLERGATQNVGELLWIFYTLKIKSDYFSAGLVN